MKWILATIKESTSRQWSTASALPSKDGCEHSTVPAEASSKSANQTE